MISGMTTEREEITSSKSSRSYIYRYKFKLLFFYNHHYQRTEPGKRNEWAGCQNKSKEANTNHIIRHNFGPACQHMAKKKCTYRKRKKGKTKSLSFRYMTSIFNIEYCNQGIAYSQQGEGGGAEETHRARSTALFWGLAPDKGVVLKES